MRVHVQALAVAAVLATASAFQVRGQVEGLGVRLGFCLGNCSSPPFLPPPPLVPCACERGVVVCTIISRTCGSV